MNADRHGPLTSSLLLFLAGLLAYHLTTTVRIIVTCIPPDSTDSAIQVLVASSLTNAGPSLTYRLTLDGTRHGHRDQRGAYLHRRAGR